MNQVKFGGGVIFQGPQRDQIAKSVDSYYKSLLIRMHMRDEVVIGSITEPDGSQASTYIAHYDSVLLKAMHQALVDVKLPVQAKDVVNREITRFTKQILGR